MIMNQNEKLNLEHWWNTYTCRDALRWLCDKLYHCKFLAEKKNKNPISESTGTCFEEKPVRIKIIKLKARFKIYFPKVKVNLN